MRFIIVALALMAMFSTASGLTGQYPAFLKVNQPPLGGPPDGRPQDKCMKTLCTSCDVTGSEKRIGTDYTLESCKNACIADDSCLAIDFGKNGRFGQCYFNYQQGTSYKSHGNFDAWTKSGQCPTVEYNRAETEVGGTWTETEVGNNCSPIMKDKICGKYRGVTGHRTSATDSPSKCANKVLVECANKEFFTWRQSNNACHCVEEPNCNSPGTNVGLDIYRADSCGGFMQPLPHCSPIMKDKICGKYRGVTGHRTSATDSPSKCANKVLAECANKEFFTWRKSNNACHCVEESNCNSPGTNVGLDIYRVDSCGAPTVVRHVRTEVEVGGDYCYKMVPLCTSCDVKGHEKRIGKGYTLEQCKERCIADYSCTAIDFGKNGRSGECYFNYEYQYAYKSHSKFDAWSKIQCTEVTYDNRAEAGVGRTRKTKAEAEVGRTRKTKAEAEVGRTRKTKAEAEVAEGQLVGGLNNMVMYGVFMVMAGFLGFYVGQRGLGNSSNKYNILPDGDEVAMVSFQTQTP